MGLPVLHCHWEVIHIDFQFFFTSFSKSFFIVLFANYSVDVNFRDYSYYFDYIWGIEATVFGELRLTMLHSVAVC